MMSGAVAEKTAPDGAAKWKGKKTMKKMFKSASILVVLALVCGAVARAQTSKRILFAKGKTTAVVSGTTGSHGVMYVVRAKSGQKLVLNLTPASKVGIKVETDGRYGEMVLLREERGGRYEVGLEETGDYTIFIGSLDGKPVPFTLTVRIAKLADV